MADLRKAAARALETHDALQAAYAIEPACDENGYPLDPVAWQDWDEGRRKPAYSHWSAAMDNLAGSLGEPGMSRHPFNFRPRCEEILAG